MKKIPAAALALALAACANSGDPRMPAAGGDFGGGWILYPPLSGAATPMVQPAGCQPAGWDRARLQAPDPYGIGQSFAALVLSEVARADRVQAFLTDDERVKLLVDAQHWFINISDYRGFDDADGWRHAVAHGSDLLTQLALNSKIDAEGLRLIVSAVGAQAAPQAHAYIHGESERLARPVLFAAARGAMDEAAWTDWLKAIATPKDAGAVFSSEAGLAWRHNAQAFVQALYVNVVLGADPADDVMRPGLEAALKAMP